MDGTKSGRKDASRGVSTSAASGNALPSTKANFSADPHGTAQLDSIRTVRDPSFSAAAAKLPQSITGSSESISDEWRRNNRSPRTTSLVADSEQVWSASGSEGGRESPDGFLARRRVDRSMSGGAKAIGGRIMGASVGPAASELAAEIGHKTRSDLVASSDGTESEGPGSSAQQLSRLPNGPHLTPPTSRGVVLEDRQPSAAAEAEAVRGGLIDRPNSMSHATGATAAAPARFANVQHRDKTFSSRQSSSSARDQPMTVPERPSTSENVTIFPSTGSLAHTKQVDDSASSYDDSKASPSSFPPSSPLLPPPPHTTDAYCASGPSANREDSGYGGDHVGSMDISDSIVSQHADEFEQHGETGSLLDDADHGWMRHTRVYGGGVCLACAAAGGGGGFYGDRVPLEERHR